MTDVKGFLKKILDIDIEKDTTITLSVLVNAIIEEIDRIYINDDYLEARKI